MVVERFGLSSNPGELSNPQHGQPALGLSQKPSGGHPWHQSRQEAAGPSGTMSDVDSTEVVYKIRQWSLPGAAVVPVLNVSSRVFWLELGDKALWTAILCYRKASFAMFSRKSVQLHGRALLVKGLRSPLCCRAVKMQMTGLTSCCRKRTYGLPLLPGTLSQRRFPKRPFVKNDADCRPSIYGWRSSWAGMCWLTGCTQRPRLGSLQAFRGKEEDARAEVEAYMEYCAKRWQTREGTYQLKRRRLLPDVRDPPEQGNAGVDMKDIWTLHGWNGWLLHGGRDAMRGWEGRDMFHPFLFCEFSLAVLVGVGLCCVCLFVCFVLVLPVKILHSISVSHLLRISSSWPTMSRARSAMQEKNMVLADNILELLL